MLKPWERWIAAIAFLLAVMLVGCASRSDRVLNMAADIVHVDAMYVPTHGDDMAAPLLELTGRLEQWGVRIEDLPPQEHVYGRALTIRTDAGTIQRVIQLRPTLSINSRFEVLAHEAGHLLQPAGLRDSAIAQVFAELVGVGVQEHYGSKTARVTAAGYLAQFHWVFPAARYLAVDIAYAVSLLTGQLPPPQWRTP